MSDIGEHFLYLAAEARRLSGTRLLTRKVGLSIDNRDILAAVDSAAEKHLLVPISEPAIAADQASQGVSLNARLLRVDGADLVFADLHCRMPPLDLVFERLVDDVLSRLEAGTEDPVETCRQALDDWRSLLKTARGQLSQEEIAGLFGELEVLRQLANHGPAAALHAWRGPSRSVHDFVNGGAELEVKTTTTVGGQAISVSNIDQLDPALVDTLHLVVVHAKPDETAPNLDELIDQLVELGVSRDGLLEKVADAGYVYESGLGNDDRYRVRSVRGWLVADSFPGLRSSEIGEMRLKGIGNIRYELNLDVAPERLSDSEFLNLISEWTDVRP